MKTFGLHAKDDDYIGAIERFIDARYTANIRRKRFQVARHPHRRTAQGDVRTEFAEQMDIRARHTAVQDVSKNRDMQAVQFSFAVANGQRVEQGLGRMFVRAVARVYHGNPEPLRNKFRSTRRTVANHDSVGPHGFERPESIEQRFAFFKAGRFRL